jgi:class 3 adenylate cyclase
LSETRKIAAILVADIVGFSRLAGADEDRILARLRALRSDLIDPTIALDHGRIVKRTGVGSLIEFRSVVDAAVRCAIEVQTGMVERNAGLPSERRIEFRVGIHLGDVVEEADGDLMGDGVNIAARLEGIAKPGAICLSEDAYRQVSGRLDMAVADLGPTQLKNIERPIRVYSLQVGVPAQATPSEKPPGSRSRSLMVRRRILAAAAAALVLMLVDRILHLVPAPDGGDDFVWIGGPGEGLRLLIVLFEEAVGARPNACRNELREASLAKRTFFPLSVRRSVPQLRRPRGRDQRPLNVDSRGRSNVSNAQTPAIRRRHAGRVKSTLSGS